MDCFKFKVNGVQRTVGGEVSSDTMLVDYLRNYLELRGTKFMCREGSCGICIVTASKTPGAPYVAFNSCLVSVASCDGWDIKTIEGLGNRKIGYHPIQTTLAENNGSQCGYCSCGWVMSMYGVLESNKTPTMKEIEHSFGSNLCRCTGYRPILTAFKKFAKDAPKEEKIMNLENLHLCKKSKSQCCKSECNNEDDWCMVNEEDVSARKIRKLVLKDGKIWFKPTVLPDVFDILAKEGTESYILVGGNTAKGVSPIFEYPHLLIDISTIKELKTVKYDQNVIVGAGTTLTDFLNILKTKSLDSSFSYFSKIYNHLDLVAHIPVRNVGTIAGNLMIKHRYNMFQSDIFLMLETVGAKLTIVDSRSVTVVSMMDFLKLDMKGKVILNVMFRPLNDRHKLYTYKLMSRAQSVHAIVNAGFLYELDPTTNVVQSATIAYGALSPTFIRATATESYLIGKPLFDNDTLQGAMRVLNGEMVVVENPPEPSVEYRRYLACALFYKGLLTLCPPDITNQRFRSATINLHEVRPVSSGVQTIDTDPTLWPLNQPITKVEAQIQCAGEAKYTDDIPSIPDEVFASFVLSTEATGTIVNIDATEALNYPGVIAFYTAKDIPGLNSFTPIDNVLFIANEEILCDGTVKHYHQPIGIIVAETQHIADRATAFVKVKYSNVTKPVLDIKEAVKDSSRNVLFATADATNVGTDIYKTLTGSMTLHGQSHIPMETLMCVAKPTEEGIEIHSTTQWLDSVHEMVSKALNLDANKIDVHVRRLGGGFGIKISRATQPAIACSLVVTKLNRPCRIIMSLPVVQKAIGKRTPCNSQYEVAVNSSGQIQYLNSTMYEDTGYLVTELVGALGFDVYNNCYDATKMNYKIYHTVTDMASNTFCRAPGTLEAIASFEHVMEQISYELSLDPIAVRLANASEEHHNDMVDIIEILKKDADYISRRAAVDSFNTQNRWKKRGLRWCCVRWSPTGAQYFSMNLSVFHTDGTVVITHAGVEMGQGINIKAMQIAAHFLKIPVEKIQIKANSTTTAPNSLFTGGSLTTTSIIIGLRRCCDVLNARLEPIRATLSNPTWEELIAAAYAADVNLQAHGFAGLSDVQAYNVYAGGLCEVELDVLTNEFEILRVDLVQDVGVSVNPEIDIGQVEGGFIMGLGYWTSEKLVYAESGELLTSRCWNYHLPVAKDIPQDFRIYPKKKSFSNNVILGSKGTGEPSICSSVVIPFAIREAMVQARRESGIPTTEWFNIDGPYSGENIYKAIKPDLTDFKFY